MPYPNQQNPYAPQYGQQYGAPAYQQQQVPQQQYSSNPYNPNNPALGIFRGTQAGESAIISSYLGEFANLTSNPDSLAFGPLLPNLQRDYQNDFVRRYLSGGPAPDTRFLSPAEFLQTPGVQRNIGDAGLRSAGYQAQGESRVRGGNTRSIGA